MSPRPPQRNPDAALRIAELEASLEAVTSNAAALPAPFARKLPPALRRIACTLLREPGAVRTREALKSAAQWDKPRAEWSDDRVIDTQVCLLRKHLRDARLPITIETVWDLGYRAVIDPPKEKPRDE